MFERFTAEARDLVIQAQAERQVRKDVKVGTEHLLLALLADPGPAGDVLRRRGIDADQLTGRGDPGDGDPGERDTNDGTVDVDDDQLLRGLGIDIDAIRDSVEKSFGPGALDRARARGRKEPDERRLFGRAAANRNGGFDPGSKEALEQSLREALRLKTKHIGPEHIGLGLLWVETGRAFGALVDHGHSIAELRADWEAVALGAAAP